MKNIPQAIRPDSFSDIRRILQEKETKDKPVQDVEEKQLYDLSVTNGWGVLRTYVQELTRKLDDISKHSIESGASFEDIGRNAVVIQLTKDYLNRVVQKVEDARESVEARG